MQMQGAPTIVLYGYCRCRGPYYSSLWLLPVQMQGEMAPTPAGGGRAGSCMQRAAMAPTPTIPCILTIFRFMHAEGCYGPYPYY